MEFVTNPTSAGAFFWFVCRCVSIPTLFGHVLKVFLVSVHSVLNRPLAQPRIKANGLGPASTRHVSRKPQYEDAYVRTTEIPQRTHISRLIAVQRFTTRTQI